MHTLSELLASTRPTTAQRGEQEPTKQGGRGGATRREWQGEGARGRGTGQRDRGEGREDGVSLTGEEGLEVWYWVCLMLMS